MPEPTSAAEREPMSSDRLGRLRAENEPLGDHTSSLTADEVGELLAEVDRARAEVVVAWELCNAAQSAFNAEYATNGQLRARLAELGEPELQQRVVGLKGRVSPVSDWDLERRHLWAPGVRLEERDVYPTPWRPADGCDGAKD